MLDIGSISWIHGLSTSIAYLASSSLKLPLFSVTDLQMCPLGVDWENNWRSFVLLVELYLPIIKIEVMLISQSISDLHLNTYNNFE